MIKALVCLCAGCDTCTTMFFLLDGGWKKAGGSKVFVLTGLFSLHHPVAILSGGGSGSRFLGL